MMFGLFDRKSREAEVASLTLTLFGKLTKGLNEFTEEEQVKIVTDLRVMVLQDVHDKREAAREEVERLSKLL